MSNRVIKVSIVLIFIMFSACLFNFCFAVTSDNKLESADYTVTSSVTHDIVYTRNVTFNFIKLNVNYEKLNTNNTDTVLSGLDMEKAFYLLKDSKELICLVPEKYESTNNYTYNWYCTNQSDYTYTYGFAYSSNIRMYRFYYDFSTAKWIILDNTTNGFGFNNNHYILEDNTVPIYSRKYNTTTDFMVYEPVIIPPTEELIANCDFNVRIEFGESEELSSNYPIKNHIGMQKVTIIHSLSNWKYYDIKLDITLEDYGFWINQRFHYAHYSTNMTSDEIKDVDTICIEEPTSINLSPNDYLGIYSAKSGKFVRLQYKIYNKSTNELILTRTIRFRFDGDGFFILQDSSDVSGTILEDSLKDSNGNNLENNTNNIVSNGKDLTDINTDFDFSSGFNLDVDTLKGTLENSIESSKSFFNLFSTFLGLLPIWISTLLYFFLFGVIIITLYRFIRGA